ncbi:MAG TPA: hypothetical protein VG273_07105 [Bryobacteraceae bacterium]|jgi:hypothetical protein|nr:hypothetical protein [Bryobacteraceae bacterium]
MTQRTVRTIAASLAFAAFAHPQVSSSYVKGTYYFTTPQTEQSLKEAATMVRTVADAPQSSVDSATSSLAFSGPLDGVNFAEWVLPLIDKATGEPGVREYKLRSGELGRVYFVPNAATPQAMQELLTVLRTVADVQRVYTNTASHAIVMRAPEWQALFADWIVGQLNKPSQAKPDPQPAGFTVGGPDYRGLGHEARVNLLTGMTGQRQNQEVLTVLRAVGDIQKVFSYSPNHALILRAGDIDLQRGEWLIQRLDMRAGTFSEPQVFTAPTGDDVTRVFYLPGTTPEGLQSIVTGLRTELKIKKMFSTTKPAILAVRGTAGDVAATVMWLAAHQTPSE